jgi:hypothetical protein
MKLKFVAVDTNLDPYPRGAPVLYRYKTVRSPKAPGGAELIPHLIDTHSGVGFLRSTSTKMAQWT